MGAEQQAVARHPSGSGPDLARCCQVHLMRDSCIALLDLAVTVELMACLARGEGAR